MTSLATRPAVGALLRDWRQRRRLSQLDLSNETGVSARHLSFLETGRSRPSREMVLHLAERLDVPLRDRNALLLAAGFAPAYAQRGLEDPLMSPVRDAIDLVLTGYQPHPAIVVDRRWTLVGSNRSAAAGSGDRELVDLHRELSALPGGLDPTPPDGIVVPLRLRHAYTELAFLSTVTTFGTAVDITAAELSIEAFLPADAHTAGTVRALTEAAR